MATKPPAAAEPADTEAPDPTNPPPDPDPTTAPPAPTTPPDSAPPPGPDPSTSPPDSPPPPEPTQARPQPTKKPARGRDTGLQPGADTAESGGGGPQAPSADSGPSLPVTGDSLAPLVGTGGVALIAGVGLLLVGRRRTR
ncbi:LPXTG cell wall anchor domain-containing protein [Micromonospora sp. NPDC049257]|uniref:LPXTG cell wall anchor domain-containing protein n=1 Tax=Micromonospora sp. NPDC049257 TaxID=3155771 RepID=UPI00342E1082